MLSAARMAAWNLTTDDEFKFCLNGGSISQTHDRGRDCVRGYYLMLRISIFKGLERQLSKVRGIGNVLVY